MTKRRDQVSAPSVSCLLACLLACLMLRFSILPVNPFSAFYVIFPHRSSTRRSGQESALNACFHKSFSVWISIGQMPGASCPPAADKKMHIWIYTIFYLIFLEIARVLWTPMQTRMWIPMHSGRISPPPAKGFGRYFENTASFLERRYTQYWFILTPSLCECSASDRCRLFGSLNLNCPE